MTVEETIEELTDADAFFLGRVYCRQQTAGGSLDFYKDKEPGDFAIATRLQEMGLVHIERFQSQSGVGVVLTRAGEAVCESLSTSTRHHLVDWISRRW